MIEKKEKQEHLPHNSTEEQRVLLSFITKTKNGEYAKIEESSLPYSRINQEREYIDLTDENYYYSIS